MLAYSSAFKVPVSPSGVVNLTSDLVVIPPYSLFDTDGEYLYLEDASVKPVNDL